MIEVLAFAGSLRRASLNRALLKAAAARAPVGVSFSIYAELSSVPLFNEDLEVDGGPATVRRLRAAVARANALMIATPEYNQSMSGVVKNLIDWLSRGEPDVLSGKPAALLGATRGSWGTRLAQAAVRQTLTACGTVVMPAPQLYVASAADKLDAAGNVVDERTSALLAEFLESFKQWIHRMQPNTPAAEPPAP